MKEVFIKRLQSDDEDTPSVLYCEDFVARVMELPWRDNQRNISCIPAGEYLVRTRYSKKFKLVYWLQNVMDRSYIYIHSGNLAGDKRLEWITHSYGCLIIGKYFGVLKVERGWQRAVLLSRFTLRSFRDYMNGENFNLTILNPF